MADAEKIFVILDPTTMDQASLVMAESIARDFTAQQVKEVVLHVYCCIDEKSINVEDGIEPDQIRNDTQKRITDWIERLVAPTRSRGLTVDTEVEILQDWRKAIVAAVARQNCVLAIKGMSQHLTLMRLFRDTSDWQLLRDLACPVYLVKTSPAGQVRKVLAAIKHRTEKQVYTEANELILDTARGISDRFGAELHVITAYEDNFNYPDRQRFADRCGLPRNQVRADMGSPHEVIAAAAKKVGADLVVIARVGKSGTKHDIGHTAERIIDALDTNLLVLPMMEPA